MKKILNSDWLRGVVVVLQYNAKKQKYPSKSPSDKH
jgi:hypothetical protein